MWKREALPQAPQGLPPPDFYTLKEVGRIGFRIPHPSFRIVPTIIPRCLNLEELGLKLSDRVGSSRSAGQ